jgi:hypothetical protein
MYNQTIKAQKCAQHLNSKPITPKQLAHEFDVSEFTVRIHLRRKFPRPKQAYWRFTPAEAQGVRAYLRKAVQR